MIRLAYLFILEGQVVPAFVTRELLLVVKAGSSFPLDVVRIVVPLDGESRGLA